MNDVAPIFERINSKGTPLTIVDLMRAATWSNEFDLMDALDDILQEIDQKDFGSIDRKVVLRSFSAAAGGGFSENSIEGLRKHKSATLQSAASATKSAYQVAVDFLSTELGIPSNVQIPYINQIVVLSEIFRLLPNPSAKHVLSIKHWFWRAAVSGYFGGWNTGNMASDQAAVKEFVGGDFQALSSNMANPGTSIWMNQQFRLNTAHAKILSLLLAFNGPVDLLTGREIDVKRALHYGNSKEYHHFFPRDYLVSSGVSARAANSLANFIMLSANSNKRISNRAPSDYLRDVEKELGSQLRSALERNLISDEAYAAACQDDYVAFITARAKTISNRAAELAGWD